MKIEVGKFYRTRGGQKAFVFRQCFSHTCVSLTSDVFDFVIEKQKHDAVCCCYPNGKLYKDSTSLFDLIAEWDDAQETLETGATPKLKDIDAGRQPKIRLERKGYDLTEIRKKIQNVPNSDGSHLLIASILHDICDILEGEGL